LLKENFLFFFSTMGLENVGKNSSEKVLQTLPLGPQALTLAYRNRDLSSLDFSSKYCSEKKVDSTFTFFFPPNNVSGRVGCCFCLPVSSEKHC